jgi:hypothetical protein
MMWRPCWRPCRTMSSSMYCAGFSRFGCRRRRRGDRARPFRPGPRITGFVREGRGRWKAEIRLVPVGHRVPRSRSLRQPDGGRRSDLSGRSLPDLPRGNRVDLEAPALPGLWIQVVRHLTAGPETRSACRLVVDEAGRGRRGAANYETSVVVVAIFPLWQRRRHTPTPGPPDSPVDCWACPPPAARPVPGPRPTRISSAAC